jgi:hypothetical protein
MRRFTIEAIRRNLSWINGIEAHLDSPSTQDSAHALLTASGWVASESEPIEEIFLACRGRKLETAKISARPDVEQAYPGSRHVVGFDINVLPIAFGEGEPLKIELKCAGGRQTTLFEIELAYVDRLMPVDAGITFAPIVGLPRSGTTLLAELLHSSPLVLGSGEYPYENRLGLHLAVEWFDGLQPWSHVRRVDRSALTVDPNYATIRDILRMGESDAATRAQLFELYRASRDECRGRIARLYRLAAPRPAGRLIVEKIGLSIGLGLLAELAGPIKPIFLIRDPRDVLVSMRAFNARRGVYEFHEQYANNYSEMLFHTSFDLFHLVDLYDRQRGDKLLVRYEDLVERPQATLGAILAYLGIAAATAGSTSDSMSGIPSEHVTAASVGGSVGRWKSELSPSEAAHANWVLRAFLARFGY